jgi:hypothetical protein
MRRTSKNTAIVMQPNTLNHLERGLQNATTNLAELSTTLFETRAMVADSLVALGDLSEKVDSGFDTGQRTSDRILHVTTQLRNEFREARAQGKNPWEWLLFYWNSVLRATVLALQLSWSITRSATSAMTFPLCLCACGCYMLEGIAIIAITDIGLMFGTCCISKYFGLSYQLFRMFIQLLHFFIFNIGRGMVECTISYFSPYAVILSEETGVSPESLQAWRHNVTSALSDFLGSRVREEVRGQVEPIVEELRNIPGDILNATSNAVVYAPKAAVDTIFGKGSGAALGAAASAVPQLAVNVAGDVIDMGSSAYEASKTALGKGAELGSTALGKGAELGRELGASAFEASKGALGRASQMFTNTMYKKKIGGGSIQFLEGRELDEFNRTIGVHVYALHDKMTEAFFAKYGKNTVLDKNTLELVVFMEKSYDLFLHSILPWVANKFKHSRAIQVEPGLRKALILRAFSNVKTNLKSKYIKLKSKSKSKTKSKTISKTNSKSRTKSSTKKRIRYKVN